MDLQGQEAQLHQRPLRNRPLRGARRIQLQRWTGRNARAGRSGAERVPGQLRPARARCVSRELRRSWQGFADRKRLAVIGLLVLAALALAASAGAVRDIEKVELHRRRSHDRRSRRLQAGNAAEAPRCADQDLRRRQGLDDFRRAAADPGHARHSNSTNTATSTRPGSKSARRANCRPPTCRRRVRSLPQRDRRQGLRTGDRRLPRTGLHPRLLADHGSSTGRRRTATTRSSSTPTPRCPLPPPSSSRS